MWDNFMRGNWPAAPVALPESPAHLAAVDAPVSRTRQPAAPAGPADGYPGVVAEARVLPRPRRAHRRRVTARLAAAFGAG